MNARFRELADKAAENLHKRSGQTWGYDPNFAKEFTELIVKECANVALNSGRVVNKSVVATQEAVRIHDKINKHFGIE